MTDVRDASPGTEASSSTAGQEGPATCGLCGEPGAAPVLCGACEAALDGGGARRISRNAVVLGSVAWAVAAMGLVVLHWSGWLAGGLVLVGALPTLRAANVRRLWRRHRTEKERPPG